jgi:lysophospholipase L1-like esterase
MLDPEGAQRLFGTRRIRGLIALLSAVLCLIIVTGVSAAQSNQRRQWTPAWAASAQEPFPPAVNVTPGLTPDFTCPDSLNNQTVRNVVWPDVHGSAVRVRLTNAFGATPLQIGSSSVAIEGRGPSAAAGTMRRLTFGGRTSITLPAGGAIVSDPVGLGVSPQDDLLVSVFVPAKASVTEHGLAQQLNFVSGGDAALDPSGQAFTGTATCWLFTDRVDVLARNTVRGTVVGLGDSITDGYLSDMNANDRWPNILARRLNVGGDRISVIDEGISTDQVLVSTQFGGQSIIARLDRDVLDQPQVRAVILLAGINDIGCSGLPALCGGDTPGITANKLIDGYKTIIRRVHAKKIKIFGATLTPFARAYTDPYFGPLVSTYWTPAKEQIREEVNHWILTSGAFDGVVDFAAAVASPRDPTVMTPIFNGGDQLHPNDRGYAAMAHAVPLSLLMRAFR